MANHRIFGKKFTSQSQVVFRYNQVAHGDGQDIFFKISHPPDFQSRFPQQRVNVTSICFYGSSVLNMIRGVHWDEEFERIKEEKLAFTDALVAQLHDAA